MFFNRLAASRHRSGPLNLPGKWHNSEKLSISARSRQRGAITEIAQHGWQQAIAKLNLRYGTADSGLQTGLSQSDFISS
jgi:hypothetical protein